jgi:hypothetical protein
MQPDIPALLDDVKKEVEQLRTMLSEGTASETKTLVPKMDALMQALATLPKEEGRNYIEELEQLHASLGELGTDFGRQASAAREGLDRLSTLSKANTAYARQGAVTGKRGD